MKMYYKDILRLITIAAVILNTNAFADAPIWKVSKGDRSLYIGGSIHLLSETDYPLPSAFDAAFKASDEIVFETDIDAMGSPATQAKFLPIMMYQDGRTIKQALSQATHRDLEAFLTSRNLPIPVFERFTPAGLNLTLLVLELQNLGISSDQGVESHFNSKAVNATKGISWLESIDQQISFISKMNELDADQLVRSTLRDIKNLKNDWPKLLSAWRSGNVAELEDLALTKLLKESPELHTFLLVERNNAWVPQIIEMLKTPDIEFIIVGALHLAGKNNVLDQLRSAGYQIQQLD